MTGKFIINPHAFLSNKNKKLLVMKYWFLFLLIMVRFIVPASAQDERWEAYMAKYSKGPGSVTANFALQNFKDAGAYPYLIVAAVKFTNCTVEGFPVNDELGVLDAMSDSIFSVVKKHTPSIFAGTFTYQCERLNYFYVQDTVRVRNVIAKMVNKDYRGYRFNVASRADKGWSTFKTFLYPNEQTIEIIENGKMASVLHKAGDKLLLPRKVDHWLYFKTDQGRTDFLTYASFEKFKVEDSTAIKGKNDTYPFALHLSRVDYVDVNSISKVTIGLRKEAKKLDGIYDGWECPVIKE